MAVTYNYALAVGKDVPASVTNVNQLIEWFKANPSKASFGTGATGSTLHFTGILLGRAAGVELSHIGYSNGQNMITDLAGGNLPACVGAMGSLLPLHKSGRIRIIATSGEQRSRFLPQVGTFTEPASKIWHSVSGMDFSPITQYSRTNQQAQCSTKNSTCFTGSDRCTGYPCIGCKPLDAGRVGCSA